MWGFALHRWKWFGLLTIASAILALNTLTGTLKPMAEVVWLDIAGEGGAALLVLIWLALMLNSRPAGRVTNLLALGLSGIFVAYWQDVMDEVIQLPATIVWDHWLESGAMPVGMLLLTLGLYHWHKEQQAICDQLRKREKLFREHRDFDRLTPLTRAGYLREHLVLASRCAAPPVLLMMELPDFDAHRRHLGERDGQRLLQEVAELLLLNLRRNDLLCRYAGHRFAALLTDIDARQALDLARELEQAVAAFAFKSAQGGTHYSRLVTAITEAGADTPEAWLERANQDLDEVRRRRATNVAA